MNLKNIVINSLAASLLCGSSLSVLANEFPFKIAVIQNAVGTKDISSGNYNKFINSQPNDDTIEGAFERNMNLCAAYINTAKFQCIFVDLRGYGLSKHILGEYTCNEASNDIKNLIQNLQLQNIHIVAHSMSTMIAQKLALLAKESISTLILITPIFASGIKLSISQEKKLLEQMSKKEGSIEEIVLSASKRYNSSWVQNRVNMAYNASIMEARVGYMKMYLSTDFSSEVVNIEIPIRIIIGKHDFPIFAKRSIQKQFSVYKDIEISECQEAGHYPMLECPVYFASELEKFCK